MRDGEADAGGIVHVVRCDGEEARRRPIAPCHREHHADARATLRGGPRHLHPRYRDQRKELLQQLTRGAAVWILDGVFKLLSKAC